MRLSPESKKRNKSEEERFDRLARFERDPRLLEIQNACAQATRLSFALDLLRASPRATLAEIRRADDRLYAAEERAVVALGALRDLLAEATRGDAVIYRRQAPRSTGLPFTNERILEAWEANARVGNEAARSLGLSTQRFYRALRRLVGPLKGARHAG